MADFCKQCSEEMFDGDYGDMKGLSTPEDTAAGRYVSVLCEGCGFVVVDHEGKCADPDCKKHSIATAGVA